MIKIAITVEAFDALASTLPLGTVAYEKNLDAKGECHVWLQPMMVDRLRFLRGGRELFRCYPTAGRNRGRMRLVAFVPPLPTT